MSAGMKWKEFLRNAENKEELINIIVKFIKSNKGWQLIYSHFIFAAGDKIYRFKKFNTKWMNLFMRRLILGSMY